MKNDVQSLDISSFTSSNAYLDFSGSNVGSMKTNGSPVLNIILKNGSSIVDTYSASLTKGSNNTRLYLSNSSAVSDFFDLNEEMFTKVELDLDGVKFDSINGNNLILAELVRFNSVVSGASFSYYRNGGGSGGGSNQQQ